MDWSTCGRDQIYKHLPSVIHQKGEHLGQHIRKTPQAEIQRDRMRPADVLLYRSKPLDHRLSINLHNHITR